MNLREWALPLYTILMQLATGSLLYLWIIRSAVGRKHRLNDIDQLTTIPATIIFSTIALALIGSHFHLSKPYLSFLAVRNFRYSWLSREVVFSVIMFFSTAVLAVLLWGSRRHRLLKIGLGWVSVISGLITIYCMANIYLLPSQIAWNSTLTIVAYYTAMLLLGAFSLIVILLMDLNFAKQRNRSEEELKFRAGVIQKAVNWLSGISLLLIMIRIGLDFYQIYHLQQINNPSAQASVRLLLELYQPLFYTRLGMSVFGAAWLVIAVRYHFKQNKSIYKLLGPVYLGSILILIGEILDRFLFYATHVRIGL